MPDINQAITVNVTVVQPTSSMTGWGAGALVGISEYATKNTAKRYTSLSTLIADHGDDSPVGRAAASAFAQGIASIWAVSMRAAGSTPTATEASNALNALLEVSIEPISAACLAGIYSDNAALTAALKQWADDNDKIFVVTNPKGATVSAITTAAAALASHRGMFVAHNTAASADFNDDIAAAALAALLIAKPGDTLMWAAISTASSTGQYLKADQFTLEANSVNFIIDLQNNGQQRLSNDLTLATAPADPKFIDITISRKYITDAIQNAIAEYRITSRKIPFTDAGIEYVRSIIIAALEALAANGVLAEYSVTMPALADISAEDKTARKLSGILIHCVLAGNIHEFAINLTLEVA